MVLSVNRGQTILEFHEGPKPSEPCDDVDVSEVNGHLYCPRGRGHPYCIYDPDHCGFVSECPLGRGRIYAMVC
jgi:hypothetical protein